MPGLLCAIATAEKDASPTEVLEFAVTGGAGTSTPYDLVRAMPE